MSTPICIHTKNPYPSSKNLHLGYLVTVSLSKQRVLRDFPLRTAMSPRHTVEMGVTEGDYAKDGAVCVRNAFAPEQIALARTAIEENLRNLSPLAKRASREDDAVFIEDFRNWQRIPAMERFIRTSPAARIAGELTGSTTIRLYHDHILVKEPGTRQITPWHQDQPYYNVEGTQNASMWLPVDPVDISSTLNLIAGTHRGSWFVPRTFLDGKAKWFEEGSLDEIPNFDAEAGKWNVLKWNLNVGDAVFFNMATVHSAGAVSSSNRRRVLSLRFLGDDMVFAPRSWITSPPFPGLEKEIESGSPMDHPLFPVLWSRSVC